MFEKLIKFIEDRLDNVLSYKVEDRLLKVTLVDLPFTQELLEDIVENFDFINEVENKFDNIAFFDLDESIDRDFFILVNR